MNWPPTPDPVTFNPSPRLCAKMACADTEFCGVTERRAIQLEVSTQRLHLEWRNQALQNLSVCSWTGRLNFLLLKRRHHVDRLP